MGHKRGHVTDSQRILFAIVLLIITTTPVCTYGKPNRTKIHSFWVAGSSSVTVKADEAILIMFIRGTGPDATASLASADRITRQVDAALTELEVRGKVRYSESRFGAGNSPALFPRPYPVRPFQAQTPSCYEVRKYVFVTFEEEDLSRKDFDQVIANTIDELTKAGAERVEPLSQLPQGGANGPVLFTVKAPNPAVLAAVAQAMAQAKILAQEVASNFGVKLDRILDARVNRPLEVTLPRPLLRPQELNVFEELHLQYYGLSKDTVTIPATFAAQYSTK